MAVRVAWRETFSFRAPAVLEMSYGSAAVQAGRWGSVNIQGRQSKPQTLFLFCTEKENRLIESKKRHEIFWLWCEDSGNWRVLSYGGRVSFLCCSFISYVASFNSWPFIRWISVGKFVPLKKRNEVHAVLKWWAEMDAFLCVLWVLHVAHACCDSMMNTQTEEMYYLHSSNSTFC